MKRRIGLAVAAAMLAGLAVSQGSRSEDLTVAAYVQMSVARLELVLDTLTRENRVPTPLEEGLLWQRYGSTANAFYSFRSQHAQAVDDYLAANPEVAAQIDQLSADVKSRVSQME